MEQTSNLPGVPGKAPIKENSTKINYTESVKPEGIGITMSTNVQAKCRKLYPEMMQEYNRIENEQRELFCKKMLDYGTGNISVGTDLSTDDDRKVSLTGLWFRMSDKINRLKNLVVLGNKPNVQDESINDTYQDLSIYGIIAQLVTRGKWGK